MKVGLFGGTFDPIHLGHLIVAESVRVDFGLDRIVFIPTCVQPHKSKAPEADADSRIRMARSAVEGLPEYSVSDAEIRRGGISYTLDTLKWFQQNDSGGGDDFFWIVGMDSLIDMKDWKNPEAIFELAGVLVAARPGFDDSLVESWIKVKARLLETPRIDISSTEIRNRVRSGKSIRFRVPEKVERLILDGGLYRR
jgi:nicotinate-nucleotide adenylyltransferase